MIDHPLIEEQQMLERYLLGELDEREAERFEDHYLTCPRCLDQLETDERLRAAIRAVGAELPPARPSSWSRTWSRPWLAAAAVLLLVAPALGYLGWRGVQLERRLGAAQRESAELRADLDAERATAREREGALAAAASELRAELARATLPRAGTLLLRLSPLRSSDDDAVPAHRLRLGSEPTWVVLLLELGAAPGERCRAVLRDAGGVIAWSAEGLQTDVYGALTLSLYSPTLAAGEHRLRIELDSGEVVEQRFQVLR